MNSEHHLAAARISDALPLQVREVQVNDPVVAYSGEGWSLTLMCPWTMGGPGFSSSWESAALEDEVWELVGRSLVAVVPTRDDLLSDPSFRFDGGWWVAVHADTDLDPWTLRVPGVVLVGVAPLESS